MDKHLEEAFHAVSTSQTLMLGIKMKIEEIPNSNINGYYNQMLFWLGKIKDELIAMKKEKPDG